MKSKGYVYISIFGESFDPDKFQKRIGGKLGGSVKAYKSPPIGLSPLIKTWWESRNYDLSDSAHQFHEELASDVLSKIGPSLPRGRGKEVIVSVVIVSYAQTIREAHGIYISTELVRQLNELGADLEYDISRRIKTKKASASRDHN